MRSNKVVPIDTNELSSNSTMNVSRLIVGLDFGTTYTGVSFCEATDDGSEARQVHVIRDWPSRHTKIGTKEKVPSEIAYLPDGTEYGSNIAPNQPRQIWMKLQLDRQQAGTLTKVKQELTLVNESTKKRPVQIIADFLRHVKDHLVKNLDEQYGEKLWKTLPMVLVMTVPAVWSDLAKSRTMEAVRSAGFSEKGFRNLTKTVTITEPEAAALCTIKTLRGGSQDKELDIDDGIVVCDMGGGTVDLISYRIATLQPTIVEEVTVGNGDLCGGSFVDRAFIDWLEDKLGVADFLKIAGCRAKDVPHTSLPQKLGRIVSDFVIEAKTGFSGKEHNFLRLPAPLSSLDDDKKRGICDGEISITPDELASMFQHSVDKTCGLLQEQLEQAQWSGSTKMKFIFLVGGFAESAYIFSQIKAFGERMGIEVIRPMCAWSAVVRGAAMKGLEVKGEVLVRNRKCRRYYGTSFNDYFVRGIHPEQKSYICAYTGKKMVRDRACWLLSKGQDLQASETTHAEFEMRWDRWPGDRSNMVSNLIASNANEVINDSTDPNVYKVATLNIDLSNVPNHLFQPRQNPQGLPYQELLFSVKIALESTLEFSITIGGKQYGSLVANYET